MSKLLVDTPPPLLRQHEIDVAERLEHNGSGHAPSDRRSMVRPVKALRALWQGRKWVAVSALFAAALAGVHFAMHPVPYESTALIMLLESPSVKTTGPQTPWEPPSHMRRLQHLATSSDVLHGLIIRHSLYRHYFIDTTDGGYFERAIVCLRGNIRVVVLDESTASITVKDADRVMAKQLADDLAEQMRVTVRRLSDHRIGIQVQLARSMVEHQEEQMRKHMARINDIRSMLGPYVSATGTEGAMQAMEFHEQLAHIGAQLTSTHSELQAFARQLELMETLNRMDPLGELIIVSRPLLDVIRAPRSIIAWSMLLWALIGAVVCACALALWALEGNEVKELWHQARQLAPDPRG